jgi:hypothetical protein
MKDRRTLKDSQAMAADLAEAMGSKLVKHPVDQKEKREAGYYLEDYNSGHPFPATVLLLRVDEKGHRYYPFGNASMKHSDFWSAGCFALCCLAEVARVEKAAAEWLAREQTGKERDIVAEEGVWPLLRRSNLG